MRRLAWLSILLLMLTACHDDTVESVAVQKVMDNYLTEPGFNGVVQVWHQGDLLHRKAYGLAEQDGSELRPDSVFQVGSITKLFTAVLMMQLVEQERLTLDSALPEIFPDECADPRWNDVTVKHLLQHTSGIAEDPDELAYLLTDLSAGDVHTLALRQVCEDLIDMQPGSQFRYNNRDYLMLGAILEKLYQSPYQQIVEDQIIQPLQLANTGVRTGQNHPSGMASDYIRENDAWQPAPDIRWQNYGAAAAVYSNADDLAVWMEALINHRLLSEAATEILFTGVPELGYVALGSWSYSAPVGEDGAWIELVERQGQVGGYASQMVFAPQAQTMVILLSNVSPVELAHPYLGQGMACDLLRVVH